MISYDRYEKDDEKEDFFDSDAPEEPQKPKEPLPDPEDPAYWEREESPWEHLKPRRVKSVWWWLGGAFVVVALLLAIWLRYFSPYVEEAVQYGYVEHIEKRGTVFKTFEGVLIPYKELMDTTRLYQRDFMFTAADGKIGAQLRRMQDSGTPVKVEYKMYHATVPWRGASRVIVTAVDTADASRILPPEFAPRRQ